MKIYRKSTAETLCTILVPLMVLLAAVFVSFSLHAQTEQTYTEMFDSVFSNDNKPCPKYEIGFSVGIFPTIGILSGDDGFLPFSDDPLFNHTNFIGGYDENYEKMYHFGSYTFNYNYHFSPKHSMGVSLSWVGKHIDTYWVHYGYSFSLSGGSSYPIDTVDGSGWRHYFTLQGNYRYTYFHNNRISLYFGVLWGITLCIRDKDILPKETIHYLLGSVGNERCWLFPAIHFNAFGIEIGKKYVFNTELGLGTQGLLKVGFKYKF
ncbi:MAG: hypothetical protein FWH36_04165 [Lentimicrobiaceae bacterium]|nr:hypothetical protein [Lentimicrobiaceae bacterium]